MNLQSSETQQDVVSQVLARSIRETDFAKDLAEEVVRLVRHERRIRTLHEAFAYTYEEVFNLWAEVRAEEVDRHPSSTRRSLISIAAVAWRAAIGLELAGREAVMAAEPDRDAIDHPVLDVVFGLLDLLKPGWTVARLADRVQFSERDDPSQAFELMVVPLAKNLDDEMDAIELGEGEGDWT